MNERTDSRDVRDEATILAALAELEVREPFEGPRHVPRLPRSPGDDEGVGQDEETLRRLYTEVLGLLPYELDPVEPREEVREALMARLTKLREERETGVGAGGTVAPIVAIAPFGEPSADDRPASGAWRWAAGLAAGVALVALVAAGWLGARLNDTETRLARAEVEREALLERLDDLDQERVSRATLERQLDQLGAAMTVATTRGVEVCALRPAGEDPLQPDSFAVLFMSPEGHWYLNANGLERPAMDAVYKVWLNTASGVVDAGVLDPQGRTDLHLGAERLGQEMMLSVVVTLEEDAHAEAPRGPIVLYGDDKMTVL